jgi:hypothetical protein
MSKSKEPFYREWLVALGLPGVIYGTGLAVLAFHFWLGVVIGYLASAWFLLDWLVVSRRERTKTRVSVAAIPIGAALLVSWIAFRPAPIDIRAISLDGNYSDDTVIAGIKWKSKYSDARVILGNETSDQYTNIVLTLRTKLIIVTVGSLSPLSQCQSAPDLPGVSLNGASIVVHGKDGDTSIPMFTPENGPIAATQYKVFCDKILSNERIELVVATESDLLSGKKAERSKPSWMSVDVEYDAYGRTHSKPAELCFAARCDDIIEVQK